jgi:integrase
LDLLFPWLVVELHDGQPESSHTPISAITVFAIFGKSLLTVQRVVNDMFRDAHAALDAHDPFRVGRALRHEEKLRLLKVAASKPEWQIGRLAVTVALNTTMRACEIRGLKWRDIDLMDRALTVSRSKDRRGRACHSAERHRMGHGSGIARAIKVIVWRVSAGLVCFSARRGAGAGDGAEE